MISDAEIKEILTAKQKEGKMACKTAFSIADEHGIPKAKIGELLNDLGIKLMSCQLGCF